MLKLEYEDKVCCISNCIQEVNHKMSGSNIYYFCKIHFNDLIDYILSDEKRLVPDIGLEDSGKREQLPSGMVREPDTNRGDYSLISLIGLDRLAKHYQLGARKYTPRNWEKGGSWSRAFTSMVRHAYKWMWCMVTKTTPTEDHLAAVAWGAFTLMHWSETYPEGNDINPDKGGI